MKYGQVMQQDRALQGQSLIHPRLRQCSPPSSTNTSSLDVDGDFSSDPIYQYESILTQDQCLEALMLSLHRQTLVNPCVLCKPVGQKENGDIPEALMICQISMKLRTYLNKGRMHGKTVGVEEEKGAVSKHLPDLLWIPGCYDLLIKAFLSSSANNRVTYKWYIS